MNHPPNVVQAIRRLVDALKANDCDAYWVAFEEFLKLHEEAMAEATVDPWEKFDASTEATSLWDEPIGVPSTTVKEEPK